MPQLRAEQAAHIVQISSKMRLVLMLTLSFILFFIAKTKLWKELSALSLFADTIKRSFLS
jgi:hypothetical protein